MWHAWVLVCGLLPLASPQAAMGLRFSKALDKAGAVLLSWDFDRSTRVILFELHAQTTGWLGFGLSPNGGMDGADIVIGGVFPNKTVYFSDYHSIGKALPAIDEKQDYKLVSLMENGTSTCMRFSRHFRTCDPNDMDITEDTMRVIFAYGMDDIIHYHTSRRGTKSIYLLQEDSPSRMSNPSTVLIKELRIPNFTIPATETTYACTFVALPEVTSKHHIYKFEPIIQAGNEEMVHHIVLYTCPRGANLSTPTGVCQDRRLGDPFTWCFQNLVAWAVGGEAFQFPSDVGISLGTPDDPTHVMMEIHYSNFKSTAGTQDNSGMRLYYTSEVRTYDAGILEVGPTIMESIFIPPMVESFKTYGLCKIGNFTMKSPNVTELKVFAVVLHTHLAGRAVQVAHFRNGSQIGFLGRDMNYDFNLQETRLLLNISTLRMGDEIVVECTYNTMDRKNITVGGLGTKDEMCMGFLYVYPRNNISNCMSVPNTLPIAQAIGKNVSSIEQAVMAIRSFQWDAVSAQMFEVMLKESTHFIHLLSPKGFLNGGLGQIPNITKPTYPPCLGMTDDNMPGHDGMPHPDPPGDALSHYGSKGSHTSPAWFLLLLLLSFQAGLFAWIPGSPAL
ncbi:putative DBH-like monooxygenase protein 2 [Lissotriton helveticus]